MRLRIGLRSFAKHDLIIIGIASGIVAFLTAGPILALLVGASLTESPTSSTAQWTFRNWKLLIATTQYLQPILNTLIISTVVTSTSVGFGAMLGWAFTRGNVPWRSKLEFGILLPMLLSPFLGAIAWVALASPKVGAINLLTQSLFGRSLFDIYTPTGVMFVMWLFHVPYGYLFTAGASAVLDPSLEEASQIMGASTATTLRRITFPLILPALGSALILVFVRTAELFSVPALLGRPGGFINLPYMIYRQINASPTNLPMAAAMGTLLLVVAVAGMGLQRWFTRQSSRFVTVTGKGYRPRTVNLGPWRWVFFWAAIAYILLATVIPAITLFIGSFLPHLGLRSLTWSSLTLKNYTWMSGARVTTAVRNTLVLSVLTPTLIVPTAILIGYVVQRTKIPGRQMLDFVGTLPIAVPGIAFGVGMIWLYFRIPLPIYGTALILLIAYVSRYFADGLRQMSGALVQLSPDLEECSRVLGASAMTTIRRITLPLVRPSALYAWMLIFMTVTREVSAAIVLYSPEATTLPVLTWNVFQSGESTQAFALGTLQLVVMALALLIARKLLGIDLTRSSA